MLIRIFRLPFYLVSLAGIFFAPMTAVLSIMDGTVRGMFIAFICIGITPLFLTFLHAALIEHSITRKLMPTKMAAYYANVIAYGDDGFISTIMAHCSLYKLLQEQNELLKKSIMEKGIGLAKRHEKLFRFLLFGFSLILLGSLGLGYTSNA